MEKKPIEIYCPICGFTSPLSDPDSSWAGLSREEKIERMKALQESDTPIFLCKGCVNPADSAKILEIR